MFTDIFKTCLLLLLVGWAHIIDLAWAKPTAPPTSTFTLILPYPLVNSFKTPQIPHSIVMSDHSRLSSLANARIIYAPRKSGSYCDVSYSPSLIADNLVLIDQVPPECDISWIVLMLDRAGAQGVIVADNVCQCASEMSPPAEFRSDCEWLAKQEDSRLADKGSPCDISLPRMYGDYFDSVYIPVIMIDWVVARKIKNCFDGTPSSQCGPPYTVIASLRWNQKINPVSLEIWSYVDDDWEFKKSFSAIAKKIDDKVIFQPRFLIHRASDWNCDFADVYDIPYCSVACVKNAYCATGSMTLNGKAAVEESLRQLCIYTQSSEISTAAVQWWQYVAAFARDCGYKNFTKECSEEVQSTIPGLSVMKTRQCEQGSWDGSQNSLLDQEIADRIDADIVVLPAVKISGIMLRPTDVVLNGLTSSEVLAQICERSSSPPHICACLSGFDGGIQECFRRTCEEGQRYCEKQNTCFDDYDEDVFLAKCSVCPPGSTYCPILRSCAQECPKCDENLKFFCFISQVCVNSPEDCIRQDLHPSGLSSVNVAGIVIFVILTLCGLVYVCWWRHQRTKFRGEVMDILQQYRPLERPGEIGRMNPVAATTTTTTAVEGV